ncbi:hypothetical protein OOK41_13635 [Micromonospora sp. NBC_01655]|uniref:hypothetical protein n=1 Tax=Micromonospora sp. NBC_01655 TaxID=2975983 RepID=UPI00225288BA|nr:hypothetical protein [Micromonospora sp. NBC_01655]MCX4471336.1 hypothetical protein [Micromonospora sp. NBC_01655]
MYALRQAFDRTTAREADRLVGEGRQADAWAMLPRLTFPAALDVAVRLAGSDWTPPDGGSDLLDRALPAARLGPEALGPSLSGTPRPLPPVPGPGSVSGLSFAPDAPLLAVGRHAQGTEIWTTGTPSLVTRLPAPDPATDPPTAATSSGARNTSFRTPRALPAPAAGAGRRRAGRRPVP